MKNMFVYALTTEERIEALRKAHIFLETDKIFLDRWHNIRGLSTLDDLELLLKSRDVSVDEFIYVIKPFNKIDGKILAKSLDCHVWYIEISRILNEYFTNEQKLEQLFLSDISYVIRPFLNDFSVFFTNLVKKLDQGNLLISNGVGRKVMQHITIMLTDIVVKVVSTNLNTFKNADDTERVLEQYLKEKYGTQELLYHFYAEYPVMTRLIIEKLIMFKNFIKKSFSILVEHSEEIKEKFNIEISGNVMTDLEFDVEHAHDRWQGNVSYTFKGDQKIVYKPKNLEIEQCFYEFINWINYQSGKYLQLSDLPFSTSIYKENLTLSLFIENFLPESENEIKAYYKRFGQLSVILYLLGAHEFNYGNVVINQEMPYIDSEIFFQLNATLLEINDEVKAETKNADLSVSQSLEEEHIAEALWWIDDFKQGLRIMSNFILDNKDNVALKLVECFTSKIKVRQHLKEIGHYYNLMQFLNHPNYLKDMFYLEKLLDNTFAFPYKDKRICVFEVDSMRQGIVPIFYTELGSKDVIISDDKRITDYFEQTPLDKVMNRIETFSFSEMEKQVLNKIANLHKVEKKDEVSG